MDNVCHTLVGGVLARAGCDRLSPLATPTMLVAANLPDVDIVSAMWGDLAYLEHHRGITHSLVGIAVEAPLLAGVAVGLARIARWRNPSTPAPRFLALTLVALIGLASHLLLDWTNSYGVRPLLPFDSSWFYGDIAFVIDPWMWLVLAAALFLGARRERVAMALWGVLFAAMAIAVVAQQLARQTESGGLAATIVWIGLLAAVVAARIAARSLPQRALAAGAVCAVVGYWVALGVLHATATRTVAASAPGGAADAAVQVATIPTFMRPDRWITLRATGSVITASTVQLGASPRVASDTIPRHLDDASVEAALATCPGEVAAGFNRFMYAEVRDSTASGERTVLLRDARFGGVPGRYGFATTPVVIDAGLRYVPDGRPCPRSVVRW